MPSLSFDHLPGIAQSLILLTIVVTAIAGVISVSRKAWPVVRGFVVTINALDELPRALTDQAAFRIATTATLAAQDLKIEEIHHEVNFNNGSSVKDAIIRVEENQAELIAAHERIETAQARLESGLAPEPKTNG